MRGRRAYLRNARSDISDAHPDAWATAYITNEARDTATYLGQGTIFGREVLFFDDGRGQRWASPLINQSWDDEEIETRSNRDAAQEETNHSKEWVHDIK